MKYHMGSSSCARCGRRVHVNYCEITPEDPIYPTVKAMGHTACLCRECRQIYDLNWLSSPHKDSGDLLLAINYTWSTKFFWEWYLEKLAST